MNIKTPLMIYREILTNAGVDVDTYMAAIFLGNVMLKGGADTIQDDFRNWVYTPSSSMTRNSNGLPAISSSSAALTAGGMVNFVAGTDFMGVHVGKPDSSASTFQFSLGSASRAVGFSYSNANGFLGTVKDDTASILLNDGPDNGVLAAASESDVYAYVGSIDVDNGASGTDIDGTLYNLSNADEVLTTMLTTGTVGTLQDDAFSLSGENVTLTGYSAYYGGIIFAFASGGLPSTWEADGLKIAKAIKAYHE